jgi:alpha-galactosidase
MQAPPKNVDAQSATSSGRQPWLFHLVSCELHTLKLDFDQEERIWVKLGLSA